LFYGPPGTGKTSTIEAFTSQLYGPDNVDYMTMKINASEERGIEIVRNKIKNFASTMPIKIDKNAGPQYKFIILDEADAMTLDAQGMLKQVIEVYTKNARFCLICNCNKKINPAIQSRCMVFNFSPLDFNSVKKKIDIISNEFGINITDDGIKTIWKLSNGDMRKVMHMLQVISITHKKITSDVVTKFKKYPTDKEIDSLYKILREGDLKKSLEYFKQFISQKHYALLDILAEITMKLDNDIINGVIDPVSGSNMLLNLRDIELNIIVTTDTDVQLAGISAVFSL
jgi:replication factor C subunit 3/5